jgi:hypothetical protein
VVRTWKIPGRLEGQGTGGKKHTRAGAVDPNYLNLVFKCERQLQYDQSAGGLRRTISWAVAQSRPLSHKGKCRVAREILQRQLSAILPRTFLTQIRCTAVARKVCEETGQRGISEKVGAIACD